MGLGHPRRGQGPHSPLRQASGPQHLGVDYIDDPEFLTPADYISHIDMWNFMVPPAAARPTWVYWCAVPTRARDDLVQGRGPDR